MISKKIEVGDQFWFQSGSLGMRQANGRMSTYVQITKVGRKWVSAEALGGWGTLRFDPETGIVDGDGYSSPGRVWPSRSDADADVAARRAWSEFQREIKKLCGLPKGLTAQQILEARKWLGLAVTP